MRSHLAHINNTLIKKKLVEKAKETPYAQYKKKVNTALHYGFPKEKIIEELESEILRINGDLRTGDHLFVKGVSHAKKACIDTIITIIGELRNA